MPPNKSTKQKVYDKFLKSAKARILAVFLAVLSTVGVVFLDELKPIIQIRFLSGTLEFNVENEKVASNGKVRILNEKKKTESSFFLHDKNHLRLLPGSYLIQVLYPELNDQETMVFEEPVVIERWKSIALKVDYKPPNTIGLHLSFPKKEYIRGEQFYFTAKSSAGGYLWLFVPDQGNPNLFFPNESYENNRVEANKTYNIPPAGSFTLVTKNTVGQEKIVGILTEKNNQSFALQCLKKVVPEVKIKIIVSDEELWGFDSEVILIK